MPKAITVSVDPLTHGDVRSGTSLRKRLPGRILIKERLRRAGSQVHRASAVIAECRGDEPPRDWGLDTRVLRHGLW